MSKYKKHISRFNKNFIWLFLLDNLGYVFSFLSLPILISKYSYATLGSVFTIQSIVLSISAIANYSFVFYVPSVSKAISVNKGELFNLWSIAVSSRILFSVLLGVISVILVAFWFEKHLVLWLLSLPILLPKIINPALFCNALEKNSTILKVGFFSKLVFLICIYFSNNSNLINIFFGISEFIVILFFLKEIDSNLYQFRFVQLKKLIVFYKRTYTLFVVSLFSMLKPVIVLPAISYFLSAEYATIYTLADKTINVIRSVSGSIFVSFFPIYTKEKFKINFLSLMNISVVLGFSVFIIIIVWFLSPMLIYVLNDFKPNVLAVKIFRTLSFSIPMFFIIIPLFSYLLNHDKWNKILLFSGIQLLLFVVLLFLFHQNILQIANCFVVSEYVLLFCYYLFVFLEERKNQTISS